MITLIEKYYSLGHPMFEFNHEEIIEENWCQLNKVKDWRLKLTLFQKINIKYKQINSKIYTMKWDWAKNKDNISSY